MFGLMIVSTIWIAGTFIFLICIGYINTKEPDKKSDFDYVIAAIWPFFTILVIGTFIFRLPVKVGEMIAKRTMK